MYEELTQPVASGGKGLSAKVARKKIEEELELSSAMIAMLLPYDRVVYDVPGKSGNAIRCDRSRAKKSIGNDRGNMKK